jgi:hypothetical protein
VRAAGKQNANGVTEVLGQFSFGLQLLYLKFSLSFNYIRTDLSICGNPDIIRFRIGVVLTGGRGEKAGT